MHRSSTPRWSLGLIIVLVLAIAACGDSDVGSGGTLTPTGDTTTTSSSPADSTTTTVGDGTTTTTSTTTPPEEPTEVFVDVYFIADGAYADAVTRAVEAPSVAADAIRSLIAGPSAAEEGSGLSSAIPSDTLLLGLAISDGLATVDLSREFEAGGGSFSMFARLAQVVYTLTQFPTIDGVAFRLDGEPVSVFSGEGIVLDGPVDSDDLVTAVPIGPAGDSGDVEVWRQDDLPPISGIANAQLGRVVLVTDDDTLNVRTAAGVDNRVIGEIVPGAVVHRLGETEVVGSSVWAEIDSPEGAGWVNATYLGAVVGASEFADDDRVVDLLDDFAAAILADGDIRPMVSQRGLSVALYSDPIHFSRTDLDGILTDPTTYEWPTQAGLRSLTFAEAITDRWLSVYDDPDRVLTFNQVVSGGHGLEEHAMPFELTGFNYVSLYDPGDDPQFGGLDWLTWYVSIDYEDSQPRIVALTIDERVE